jgi:hypothetical protein
METAGGLLFAVRWERGDKSAAVSVRVLKLKAAKVGLGSPFGDGQTQPGSAADCARVGT